MKSMLSCCVAPDELGKIYALLSALDNLFPLGVTEGYSLIFEVSLIFTYIQYTYRTFLQNLLLQATIESKLPGTIFFISAAVSGLALVSSVYILISLKGKRMSEVTADGSGRGEKDKNDVELSEKSEISDIDSVITGM